MAPICEKRNVGFALTTNGWWSAGPLSFPAVWSVRGEPLIVSGGPCVRAGALGVGVPPVVELWTGSSADEFQLLCHRGCVPIGQDGLNFSFGEVDPEGACGAVAFSSRLVRSHCSFHRSAMGDFSKQCVTF